VKVNMRGRVKIRCVAPSRSRPFTRAFRSASARLRARAPRGSVDRARSPRRRRGVQGFSVWKLNAASPNAGLPAMLGAERMRATRRPRVHASAIVDIASMSPRQLIRCVGTTATCGR
jgi:hypothetical protein